jgi:SAM-dependent methyltransferase
MLEHARRNAATAGLQNVEFVECAAEDLEADLIPFDASISRLGLMLFPSPDNALRAVQRVLKPAARFAALVFTIPDNNPFMARPMAILLRHAGKAPPAPGRPGIFALGADGVLESLMKESGLTDVKSTKVGASLRLATASDALEMMQKRSGRTVR